MSTVLELNVGSINIPNKVGEDNISECWERTASRSTVFGTQECFSRRQRRIYRRKMRNYSWGSRGMGASPNPIFWDKEVWEYVSHRVILLHDESGRKDHPGFNAERYMTEVVLRHSATGVEVAFLNTHWTAPFWVSRVFLVRARRAAKSKARKRIKAHLAAGRPVVFMGDTNIGRKIKLASVRWLRGKGIDKLGIALPKGWVMNIASAHTFKAPTDHGHGVEARAVLALVA